MLIVSRVQHHAGYEVPSEPPTAGFTAPIGTQGTMTTISVG
jgi:hypothetical protein